LQHDSKQHLTWIGLLFFRIFRNFSHLTLFFARRWLPLRNHWLLALLLLVKVGNQVLNTVVAPTDAFIRLLLCRYKMCQADTWGRIVLYVYWWCWSTQ
jgi:hypothetical protein